jgi:Zn finger protein HypA/HybF involved in hydrogenase expression
MFPAQLTSMECGKCGGVYAITERFREECFNTKRGHWNCPYCQSSWTYSGKTEAQQLRDELDNEKRKTQWAKGDASWARGEMHKAKRATIAQKAAKTRIKNRIAKGVCPCCNRYFADVHAHLHNEHPDFENQEP